MFAIRLDWSDGRTQWISPFGFTANPHEAARYSTEDLAAWALRRYLRPDGEGVFRGRGDLHARTRIVPHPTRRPVPEPTP